jgi:hypothetical protein
METTLPVTRRTTNVWLNLLFSFVLTGLFMSLKKDGYIFETATLIYYSFFFVLYLGIVLCGMTLAQWLFLKVYEGRNRLLLAYLAGMPAGITGLYLFLLLLRAFL